MWLGYVGRRGRGGGGGSFPGSRPGEEGFLSSHADFLSLSFEHVFTCWHHMAFQAHRILALESTLSKAL